MYNEAKGNRAVLLDSHIHQITEATTAVSRKGLLCNCAGFPCLAASQPKKKLSFCQVQCPA